MAAKQVPPEKTAWFMRHPEQFDINKLESNEMLQRDGQVIAKIPQIEGRIRRTEGGHIELVIGRETDPETGGEREKTIPIGYSLEGFFPGMMQATDVYYDYFDLTGRLIYDPMNRKEARTDDLEKTLHRRVEEELKKKNQIRLGDTTLVCIPKEKNRLLPANAQGLQPVEYTYMNWYDLAKRQSRNRKAIIGHTSGEYPDAMIPNDRYNRYFDIETGEPRKPEEWDAFDPNKAQDRGNTAENEASEENEKSAEEAEEELIQKNIEETLRQIVETRKEWEENRRKQEEYEREKELYGDNEEAIQEAAQKRLQAIVDKIKMGETA